ncbi:MAG: DUF6762 family protein [Sedimentibacter sp.]
MDNYNNLLLMLKDEETGFFIKTIGSFEIPENIEYIDKVYSVQNGDTIYIYLTLTTHEIEEDWKYSGVFDLYNEEIFSDKICDFEELSGDYNPKWVLKIKYSNDNRKTEELINEILDIHIAELERILPIINPEDYIEE